MTGPDPSESTYALADDQLPRPALPGDVVVSPEIDELIDHVAADMTVHAENCVRMFGDFHLALSGDPSLAPLYRRLMYDPNYRRLPWRRTHLWVVAELAVPLNDERSCFRLISELIADHADIPLEQVHPVYACAEDADVAYERELQETLAWREKGQDRLDYVLLVLGPDGQTAGLLPNSEPLRERRHLVRFGDGGVTMTPGLINAARFIAVVATGRDAAPAIERVVSGRETADTLPIKGVRPLNGELRWYLDAEACGLSPDDDAADG